MLKIIFIVGPTAVGKTKAAFLLAKHLGAEIISADSMLIYQEPKIITAKPPEDMLRQVKHHFVGVISVRENYSVFDYCVAASKTIKELVDKNIPVIVCGGSGLYIKAIIDGIFKGPGKDETLRGELAQQAQTHGQDYLYRKLERVDSISAAKISPNDLKRIIRALEVYYLSGVPISKKQQQTFGLESELPIEIFGLRIERKSLYQRINKRVDQMFEAGAIDEVKGLLEQPLSLTAKKIIGLSEISEFLNGRISTEEARQTCKKNTRNFAKRQVTWFKKDKRIQWIDVGDLDFQAVKNEIIGRSSGG